MTNLKDEIRERIKYWKQWPASGSDIASLYHSLAILESCEAIASALMALKPIPHMIDPSTIKIGNN